MIKELINDVEEWGKARDLHTGDKKAQYIKIVEEVGELGASIIREDTDGIIDGIGDAVVTLIISAMQHGYTLEYCLAYAYDEIKDRTGVTTENGFIKD